MIALLKLIPLKDWLYAALITALVITFSVYSHHERVIGEQKVERADAKAVNAQIIHNTEVEARAKTLADTAAAIYKFESSLPPAVDAPHLWVRSDASCDSPVPADVGTRSGADGSSDVSAARTPADDSTVEHAVDIGPSLDKLLQDADAEVRALQEYVRSCQDEGVCKR
jgi:hypothetical protein